MRQSVVPLRTRALGVRACAICVLTVLGYRAFADPPAERRDEPAPARTAPAPPAAHDAARAPRPYVEGRIIVKFREGRRSLAAPADATMRSFEGDTDLAVVAAPDGLSVPEAVARYSERADVLYAEPDYLVTAQDIVPSDPRWSEQWDMVKIGAPSAWTSQTDAGDVVVAVLDTGIDFTHPDLAANLWTDSDGSHGFTARNGLVAPGGLDDNGHGTHVAGTIGAAANNGSGIAGINWDVRLLALKFLDANGSGASSDAILLLDKAVELKQRGVNLRVINNSWGGGAYSQALKDAFSRVESAGILNVCAAGNSGQNADLAPMYPGAFDNRGIVSVLATDTNDAGAAFSNYGLGATDLAAPGVNTLSTVPAGTCTLCDATRYRYLSGTSMATPHVTGVVAALFHENPALTVWQARDVLLDPASTDRMTDAKVVQSTTSGRLSFAKALANPLLRAPRLNGFPTVTADAGVTASAGSAVTLSATVSDPDGDALRTAWTKARYQESLWLVGKMLDIVFPAPSGNPATFTAPSLAVPVSLSYTASTADGRGGSASARTLVTVPASPAHGGAPAGTLTVTPSSGPIGTVVTVSFPAVDPEGGTVLYDLVMNGKQSSSGICCYTGPVNLTMNTAGVYRFRTQAVDRELGLSPSSSVLVSIGGATGVPPVASATVDRTSGPVPLNVAYDLRASYDPDGSIAKYEIDCLGDGSLLETTSPTGTCTFTEPGPHLVRLYTVDNSASWDSAYFYVMALPPSGDTTAPVAVLTSPADGSTVARGSVVAVTASATDDTGVVRVDFTVDGAVTCSDSTPPYGCSWSVPSRRKRSYTLEAIAYDAAGNTGRSAVRVSTR